MSDQIHVESVQVKTHIGRNLIYLAEHYAHPYDSLREALQNALDPDVMAQNVLIEVDLKKKRVKILDDGLGWTREGIRHRLENICQSDKSGGMESYGSKGIGNLAGIAIAEEVRLVSRPREASNEVFYELRIKKAELPHQKELSIPIHQTHNFVLPTPYTTLVIYDGIQRGPARHLEKFDELCDVLQESIESDLKKDNPPAVIVRMISQPARGMSQATTDRKLTAQEFPGKHEERVFKTPLGDVRFHLFLSGEKAGNTFRVQVGKIIFSLSNLVHYSEVSEVFESGYIQGWVECDFCTVTADKQNIQWDDKYDYFWSQVTHCAAELKEWLAELQKKQKSEKLDRLLQQVAQDLADYLKSLNQSIPEELRSLAKMGNKGAFLGARKQKTRKDIPSLPKQSEPSARKSEVKANDNTNEENRQGSGLPITYSADPGALWRSKLQNEKIVINIAHVDYEEAERKGEKTEKLYLSQLIWFECSGTCIGPSLGF